MAYYLVDDLKIVVLKILINQDSNLDCRYLIKKLQVYDVHNVDADKFYVDRMNGLLSDSILMLMSVLANLESQETQNFQQEILNLKTILSVFHRKQDNIIGVLKGSFIINNNPTNTIELVKSKPKFHKIKRFLVNYSIKLID